MRSLISNSSFFFNDTATTEFYTLSLHDALPIFPRLADQLIDRRHRFAFILHCLAVNPPEDRTSTRLNSSHVRISYAVFCLKTKKSLPPPFCALESLRKNAKSETIFWYFSIMSLTRWGLSRLLFFLRIRPPPPSTLFPYTTLFR